MHGMDSQCDCLVALVVWHHTLKYICQYYNSQCYNIIVKNKLVWRVGALGYCCLFLSTIVVVNHSYLEPNDRRGLVFFFSRVVSYAYGSRAGRTTLPARLFGWCKAVAVRRELSVSDPLADPMSIILVSSTPLPFTRCRRSTRSVLHAVGRSRARHDGAWKICMLS